MPDSKAYGRRKIKKAAESRDHEIRDSAAFLPSEGQSQRVSEIRYQNQREIFRKNMKIQTNR